MKVNQLILNINSENPERLIAFYRDTVGLPAQEGMGPGAFNLNGALLVLDGHSDVKGQTTEARRYLFSFMVDDLAAEHDRLEAAGVQSIRKMGREYWGGVISTFADPDGNYFQVMEYKPE